MDVVKPPGVQQAQIVGFDINPDCLDCRPIKLAGEDFLWIDPSPQAKDCPRFRKLITTCFCTCPKRIKVFREYGI